MIQVAAEELGLEPAGFAPRHRRYRADPGRGLHRRQPFDAGFRHRDPACRRGRPGPAPRGRRTPVRRAAGSLRIDGGAVAAPDGRRLSLGEIAPEVERDAPVPEMVPLADPARYTRVGRALPRVDIPAKVAGGAAYVQDIRRPAWSMRGSCARPAPAPARECRCGDGRRPPRGDPGASRRQLPGGAGRARIRRRDGDAGAGQGRGLAGGAQRCRSPRALCRPGRSAGEADDHPRGRPRCAGAAPGRRDRARYRRRYQMHGSIGPSCAWPSTTAAASPCGPTRKGCFPCARRSPRCCPCPRSRCAASMSRARAATAITAPTTRGRRRVAGPRPPRPAVRVQYTREQEHLWEPYGGAMTTECRPCSGRTGGSPTGITRCAARPISPAAGGRPAALGRDAGDAVPGPPPKALRSPRGGGDRNAIRSIAWAAPGGA